MQTQIEMKVVGTNIISSLGFNTKDNFDKIKQGISGLKKYSEGTFDLPEPFVASLIDRKEVRNRFDTYASYDQRLSHKQTDHLTLLEKAAVLSILYANEESGVKLSSDKTVLVFSTTKGNVDLLGTQYEDGDGKFLWYSAKQISDFIGNPNKPIVVSNACIYGAAAQIIARRELQINGFDNAIVVGVDFLSKFIISGFMSFKALSPNMCQPFDKERCGLNLGEAVATIILSREKDIQSKGICLLDGAIRNDATHISAPSRVGEGCSRALRYIMENNGISKEDIAFINAHGTATPYNDSMEGNAIFRSGLGSVPVNSFKSCFGHTLGAAGILETIIAIKSLENSMILPTLNFVQPEVINIDGQQFSLNVTKNIVSTDKRYFIKIMSGFGGVNSALLFKKRSH